MNDLVCVKKFADRFEADLAKNALQNEGITAILSATAAKYARAALLEQKGIGLLVSELDQERALEILETGSGKGEEASASPEMAADMEKAAEEFREIEEKELREKAASVESNGNAGIVCLIAGIALLVFDRGSGLWSRIGIGALAAALVQYFCWKDALNARQKLAGKIPPEKNENTL